MGASGTAPGASVVQAAIAYLQHGWSVIPTRPARVRAEKVIDKGKVASIEWAPYQARAMTPERASRLFSAQSGIAAVLGRVSGVVVVDFDVDAGRIWPEWARLVEEEFDGLLGEVPIVGSPGGEDRRHVHLRVGCDVGTTKLAMRGRETLVEVKAEGGYVLVPGSSRWAHPASHLDPDRAYRQLSGPPLLELPTTEPVVDEETALTLLDLARRFDENGNRRSPRLRSTDGQSSTPLVGRPLDAVRAEVEEILDHVPGGEGRERWHVVGQALKRAFGEGAFPLWDEWSRRFDGYGGLGDQRYHWDSFGAPTDAPPVTLRTLLWLARRKGGWQGTIDVDEPPPPLLPDDAITRTLEEARDGGLADLIREAATWARTTKGVAVVAVPVGVGKTRVVAEQILPDDPESAVLVTNYMLRDEFAERCPVECFEAQGTSRSCTLAAVDAWRPRPDASPSLPRTWRGTACVDCPERGGCPAWASPVGDRPVLAVHQLGETLARLRVAHSIGSIPGLDGRRHLLDGRTLYHDESAVTVDLRSFSRGQLLEPFDHPERFKTRDTSREDGGQTTIEAAEHAAAVQAGGRVLEALAGHVHELRRRDEKIPRADVRVLDPALFNAATASLSGDPAADLRRLAEIDPRDLWQPSPRDARSGDAGPGSWPDPDLPRLWKATVRGAGVARLGSARVSVAFVVGDDRLRVELRQVRPVVVPKDGGTVVLDATGFLLLPELQAANPKREVRVLALGVPAPGSDELLRLHVRTRGLTRGRLCRRGQPRRAAEWHGKLRSVLRVVADELVRMGLDPAETNVGIITHAPIARVLTDPTDKGERVRASIQHAGGGAGGVRLDPRLVGYYGRDGHGTNAFQEVECLVTLGDPWNDVAGDRLDAELLGLDPKDTSRRRMLASLEQGQGRLRPLEPGCGPRLAVHAGTAMPPSWGPEAVRSVSLDTAEAVDRLVGAVRRAVGRGLPVPLEAVARRWPGLSEPSQQVVVVGTVRKLGGKDLDVARRVLDDALDLLERTGIPATLEPLRVPGRRGRPPLVLRRDDVPVEVAQQRLATVFELRSIPEETAP